MSYVVAVVPSENDFKKILFELGLGTNRLGELRSNVSWIDHLLNMHTHYQNEVFIQILIKYYYLIFVLSCKWKHR